MRKTKPITLESALEQLLNDLCVEVGFCVSADKRRTISTRARISANEFAVAVLEAEGLQPKYEKLWLRRISARFTERFGRGVLNAAEFQA
jgi:hypothetical protein